MFVSERAAFRVQLQLRDGLDRDVGVGNQRDAVFDRKRSYQTDIRLFIVVRNAGQNVDDQVEPISLQQRENVGFKPIGDLVNFGAGKIVAYEELVGSGRGKDLNVEAAKCFERFEQVSLSGPFPALTSTFFRR